jgi:hypothetical protein
MATHGGPELAVHQPVEQGVPQFQSQPHASLLACLGESDGGIGCLMEDGALAAVLGLGEG